MNQSPVSFIKAGDRVLTLSRPVLPHAARRLVSVLPQLTALNEAGKSQADAAAALEIGERATDAGRADVGRRIGRASVALIAARERNLSSPVRQ